MYIINVIPLVKIPFPNPQILSYFFSKKLSKGALVRISLRKKQINAIVFSLENLEKKKLDIKKSASFKLKPIEKVVSKNPILTKNQIKLLLWFSEYYFSSLGLVARLFVPQKLINAKKSIINFQLSISNKAGLSLTPETKKDVFAPFNNLKSITVENADSQKYISWGRQPYYDARKIALQRGKILKAKITLKTNLPSIETYYWAGKNKYKLKIQDSRFKIQDSKIVDMRKEIKSGNYSIFSQELQKKLKKSKKSILYISRRGTATFILCRDCGYIIKCPRCEVPMTYHQNPKLLCHHCGNEEKPPALCPNCKGYRIKYFGAGTQRVEIEIKKLLPKAKIFRLDSDTARKPEQQQKIINKFNALKNGILIGTQMLLEKDIKPTDLVGIVSVETILNLPDYRSSERVFKILNQLQLMSKKEFLIQTYNPKNTAIKNALDKNWKKFYDEEIKIRRAFNYPPFSQIIKLNFEHKDPQKAEQEAKILFEKLKTQAKNFQFSIFNFQLFGPVPAFIPRIKGKYRWQIIIKNKIKNLKQRNKLLIIVPSNWNIEVDPESLL